MSTTVTPRAAPSPLGSLSQYESYDATPVIGTVFSNKSTQLSQLLEAPNADGLLHDLAVLVSHRGVVFFKDQDITVEQQKRLGQKLGELTGKPETSKLHRHPVSEDVPELGLEISVISSKSGGKRPGYQTKLKASGGWHSDVTFEKVPSDYAILKLHTLPPVGGDTLWASGYEAYDRLSPAYQKFLEGLTATHDGNFFHEYAEKAGRKINLERGAPENVGIRYRWGTNDVAIWDNRVTVHAATHDYLEHREGNRVVSLGEKPYFDPDSKSRREVLVSSLGGEPHPDLSSSSRREGVKAAPPHPDILHFDAL
ncbi:TauD-domain-containing protein [Macrolepiota fuliginosa MF-IS2]|uniref:TauD-domain-containing protein n=1 Tax=Macrolepiota fuliginosa MF-IS2 TaxID=1400762 RepID=A0A9P6BW63_9AGAR|nr:TauD-domain-containing protein [Macrolepiota fuliginosa MF-IS2]